MALTTGTLAASATPATDFMALLNTRLLAGGWVEEVTRTYTAAIMGTTANCRVYYSPSTTVAAGIYTGAIISIEVDDTNSRVRVRCCEKFDSSLSGAAALNTKWAAGGTVGTSGVTPSANYAFTDSFVSHFQAQGVGQSVGWVELLCSGSGFNYWLGVNANRWVFMSNSSGIYNVCMGGQLAYAGDLLTSVGNAAVFLLGNSLTVSTTTGSWAVASAGAQQIVRTSREVGTSGTSLVGAFAWQVMGPMVAGGEVTAATEGAFYGGPGANPSHKFFQASMLAFPAWLHPTTNDMSNLVGRSNYATIPEALVFMRNDLTVNTLGPTTKASFPNIGELATAGGVTYTSTGQIQAPSTIASTGMIGTGASLWIDGSQFS